MENTKLGSLLQDYRRKKYLSVRKAAESIGMHYTYLSRLENGMSEPSDDVLDKISEFYELSKDETAELFLASKLGGKTGNVLAHLSQKKVAEIMFRISKDKK